MKRMHDAKKNMDYWYGFSSLQIKCPSAATHPDHQTTKPRTLLKTHIFKLSSFDYQ